MVDIISCPNCSGPTRIEDRVTRWDIEIVHKRVCDVCDIKFDVVYSNPTRKNITYN